MARPPTIDFLDTHHHAVLGTFRKDNSVQLSPVLAVRLTSSTIGISSRETAIKTKNLRNNPSAFICVFQDTFFGDWIQIDGIASVHSLPGAMEELIKYYRLAAGEHDDWDGYRASMAAERRVLIEITTTRIGPNVSG
jgi:PPOX class probable F420-dependent enzyme